MKPRSSSSMRTRACTLFAALALAACAPKSEPSVTAPSPTTKAMPSAAAVDGGHATRTSPYAMRASTANPHLERTALPIGGLSPQTSAPRALGHDEGARDDACAAACAHLHDVERANKTGPREVRDAFPERVRGEFQEMLLVSTGGISPSHCERRCVAGTFDPTCASKIEKLSGLAACVRGPLFPKNDDGER